MDRVTVISTIGFSVVTFLVIPSALADATSSLLGMHYGAQGRLRVIVETDAGGDPDDEQSLVRFLLYANEWDVEGIICNRPTARDGENRNSERTGLGIVRNLVKAGSSIGIPSIEKEDLFPEAYPASSDTRKAQGKKRRFSLMSLVPLLGPVALFGLLFWIYQFILGNVANNFLSTVP